MKNFIRFFLIIILSVVVSSSTLSQDQVQSGKAAIQQGNYDQAISIFRSVTQKEKRNAEAFRLLGEAFLKADSLTQAEQALIQSRVLDPENARTYELIGDVYAEQRLTAAAIDQYKRASQLDSTNVNLHLKVAEANRKVRQYNEAARAYLAALDLDSMNLPALRQLSDIYMRAKQYANAGVLLERLMRAQPDSLNWKLQYVRAMSEIRGYEKLVPVAEEVLKTDPQNIEVQAALGEAYKAMGKTEEAIAFYARMNPDSMTVEDLVTYGKALKSVDEFDKAVNILQKALAREPDNCEVPYDLGTLYMKARKYTDAVSMFEKKIACDTSAGYQFASHLNAAMSLMQLKRFRDAKDHAMKSLQFRPENVQAWQVLAQINGQIEQIDDEITAYKKVIDLATNGNNNGDAGRYNSQVEEAYRIIGVRYLIRATKSDDPKRAKDLYATSTDYLRKAIQLNPRDCNLNLWTAQSYHNLNNKDEAKRYYCRVIELCPKAKEAEDAKKGLDLLGLKCGQ